MRIVTILFLSVTSILLGNASGTHHEALIRRNSATDTGAAPASCYQTTNSSYAFAIDNKAFNNEVFVITEGSMPAKPLIDAQGTTIVYGIGDSLMMITGSDIRHAAKPELIALVPKMFSHAMRGPQAVKTAHGIVITVCTEEGNIYSFSKQNHKWVKSPALNQPETAKEGLSSLAADGNNVVAIWLNLKQPKGQSLYAARSSDGGKKWSKPYEIYTSPDGTICECCKPSVVEHGKSVYVMFRNWLNGNRDMHLLTSLNGGETFGAAEKIGTGSWPLNGCPMDGGDIVINHDGQPATIWRREGKLYSSVATGNEQLLGKGKNGSIETDGTSTVTAWTEQGHVIIQEANGQQHDYGEGTLPLVRKMNDHKMLCIWQRDKKIVAVIR